VHHPVGTQVFFVRDGMKFPDMVHALKPNPKNHIQEGWRIADFFSHHPESMHMVRAGLADPVRCSMQARGMGAMPVWRGQPLWPAADASLLVAGLAVDASTHITGTCTSAC
jgi:hypothetical protein